MAGKNDAIEIDALLTPELGDMGKVERELSKVLANAAKPLVDSISNTKVGLNPAALKKVQRQLDTIAKDFGDGFDESITKVLGEQNKNLRSAKGLRQLAKADSGIAKMVKILGGYDEAASILGRPDANRRLNQIGNAFRSLNDVAFQISKLPTVSADVQRMLGNLYKSNTPNSFKKLSEIQQRQVMDAMAVIDLQDKAFNSLKGSLAKAGLGVSATELSKQLKQRKNNASRLGRITSPDALVRQERAEARAAKTAQERQDRLDKARARTQAVSLEKDRIIGQAGGIAKLRKKPDIRAVRAGLNRDYNMAVEQASIAAMGKGGQKGSAYKAATGKVDGVRAQMDELNQLVKSIGSVTAAIKARNALDQREDLENWRTRGIQQKKFRLLNEKADQDAWKANGRLLSARNAAEQKFDIDRWKEEGRVENRNRRLREQADVQEWKANGMADRKFRLLNQAADLEQWKANGRLLSARNIAEQKADQDAWKERGRLMRARIAAEQRADQDAWKARGKKAATRKRLEEQADLAAASNKAASAARGASFAEAQRLIGASGGIGKMTDNVDIASVRSGINSELGRLVKDREVANAYGQNTAGIQANIDALRAQRRELSERTRQLAEEQRALKDLGQQGLRTKRATNLYQARDIIRSSGGDYSELDKEQIRTVRPYAQDRFRARSQYAEKIGADYGTDSPEFARASASAQQYAKALGELDKRAKELRPSIGDLGQVVRSFFRYALGYGALYEMLGAVTALTRGLVDLDEQLYNIQAITLSTDNQMQTIEGSIKQVGLTTKFTLNEVAKGAQILAQAGTAPEAIPDQLRAVADFAAATGSSLEQSADLLTSFKNVFKDISDGSAADLLAKTLNLSKLQGEDLRTIISYTAQTAEGYNISAEQLMGAVATLRNVGIKPSTIATGLRQAMLEIFNPDTKLTKALKTRYAQLGEDMSAEMISARYNSFTFAEDPLVAAVSELKRIGFGGEASNLFSRAFDVRAFNPLQALVNNFDQFNALSSQVGVGRTAKEGSEIQLESLRATLENLGASVVAFSDSVGGDMVRSLQSAAKEATNLVTQLTELDQKMKLETGAGLGSSIMGGLAGGALGAVLGGKGFLGRAGGFTAGAVAGGGITQANASGDSGAGDYVVPAIAALSVLLPGFMKLATAAKGMKGGGLQMDMFNKAAGGISVVGGLSNTIEGIAGMTGKLGKFSGLARVGMIGAGLFARAIPVIGWLWTAYEILQLFSDKGAPATQDMADTARIRATAAGDQSRTLQTKYNDQQSQIGQYRIDEYGNADKATTAGAIVRLREESNNLNLSLGEVFGTSSNSLSEATQILRDYQAKSFEARQADLTRLSQMAGKSLTDLQAADLATQVTQLQQGVEGIRKELTAELQRTVDKVSEAAASGDSEGVEAAGATLRVLDQMPELKQFFYGEIQLSAERATELYVEFSRKLAEESEKGAVTAEEVLASKVTEASLQIDAAAAALESSAALDTAVRGVIDGLELSERFVIKTLDALAVKAQEAAAGHAAEAEKLEAKAAKDKSTANNLLSGWAGEFGGLLAPGYMQSAKEAEAAAAQKRRQQAAQEEAQGVLTARSAQRKDADRVAATIARTASQDTEKQILDIIDKGRLTEEIRGRLSATDRATLGQLQGGNRVDLVKAGFFQPEKVADGKYRQSPGVSQLEKIIRLVQQTEATKAQVSDQKKSESAKSAFASDPTSMVQIAKLQNQQKAAERRNDFAGASAAARRISELQYAEQSKAVKRAEVEMTEAKEDPKKDATAAVEKYNSELAKLESLRGDMADKLDEYQKKVQDIDLRNRAAGVKKDQDRIKGQFTEAVDRGDLQGAIDASKSYEDVQRRLKEVMEEELQAKGMNAEQIKTEVEDRKDLTTQLIDQEGAQKRLTSAIIARADFEARNAGTGPTTGNKMVDSYLEASGVGFTDQQQAGAYERDLALYQQKLASLTSAYQGQMAGLTTKPDEARAAEQTYIQSIEQVQSKIGETSAQLQQLRNDFGDELLEGLNPTALANQLSASGNSLQNFGENLRTNVIGAIDGVGQALANAVLEGDNLKDSLQAVVYEFASTSLTQGLKLGVTEGAQGLLGMIAGDGGSGETAASDASSMLGKLLGMGQGSEYGSAQITAGTVFINGAVAGQPTTPGAVGDLFGGTSGGNPAGAGTPATAADPSKPGGMFSGLTEMLGSLKTGLTDAIGGLGGLLSGVLGSLFGGVGGSGKEESRGSTIAKWAAGTVMSYYGGGAGAAAAGGGGGGAAGGSAGYTGAFGFANGGMPSRKITGPRGGRDNLAGAAMVNGQAMPIRVESDEGILSRKAMGAIGGENGLKLLNSGKMPRFSVGGVPAEGYNSGGSVSTGADQMAAAAKGSPGAPAGATPEVNVANIYSEQGFADFVSSRGGRKVIINMMKQEGLV